MDNFKPGDRVIRKKEFCEGTFHHKEKTVYVITRVMKDRVYLKGLTSAYDAFRFDLAKGINEKPSWL